MRVTLKQVAQATGVSFQVVSEVLNGKKTRRVAPETREKIERIAKEMGYCPNLTARALNTGKTHTIGVLLNSPADRFYAELMEHIHEYLIKRGYTALFGFWGNDISKFMTAYNELVNRGVDGIISCEYSDAMSRDQLPLVTFECHNPSGDTVLIDFEPAMLDAVAFLKRKKYKKIGYCGTLGSRHDALLSAFAACGIRQDKRFFLYHKGSAEFGKKAAMEYLAMPERPDVIFAQNAEMALSMIGVFHTHGINVPEDIRVISCHNTELANYASPPIQGLESDEAEITETLCSLVLNRISNPKKDKVVKKLKLYSDFNTSKD